MLKNKLPCHRILFFLWFLVCLPAFAHADGMKGFNLAGAEFGPKIKPGKQGTDYFWPTAEDVEMYAGTGANILRIPFLWERLQPALWTALKKEELASLDIIVSTAAQKNVLVILDVHNYGKYNKNLIGDQEVPVSAYTDFWSRLARHYKSSPNVVFGLMNEPHKHTAKEWADIAQAAIQAIRTAGASHLILVPGTYWSGAHSWLGRPGRSNAEALKTLKDPANNFMFDLHQYLDSNSSGMHDSCVNDSIGVKRLTAVTAWLRQTKTRAFLSEFGATKNPVCLRAMENMLDYMDQNDDVWGGWTYWAASKWFGNYMFNIYPPDAQTFPQLMILQNNMKKQGR